MVNLESVFAVLREQCPVSMQSDVQRLGAAFYCRMETDEFARRTPEQWAALVMGMLEFARVRSSGTANVRVRVNLRFMSTVGTAPTPCCRLLTRICHFW